MRRAIKILGVALAVVVVGIAIVLITAVRNLSSLIARQQAHLLERISDSLGRKVEVASIEASLGWGLEATITGLKIQDNPALSDSPFVEANYAYAKVDLLPLLARRVHVTEIKLENPVLRIIRSEQGEFNFSTLGKKFPATEEKPPEESQEDEGFGWPKPPWERKRREKRHPPVKDEHRQNLGSLYVASLLIANGVVQYEERGGANQQTTTINQVDLAVKEFSVTRAFDFSLKLAMLSEKQNVDVSGSLGPLAIKHVVDVDAARFAVQAKIGPIEVARLRAIGALGKAIPEALSVPDPISFEATANGTAAAVNFHLESDLTGTRLAWADLFNKPASVVFKLSVDGSRNGAAAQIALANLKLGDLDANAHDIAFAGGNLSARIDTNSFDIGALTKMVPALQKYDASGHAEMHSDLQLANGKPAAHGTISLGNVALARADDKKELVNNLFGDIKLNGEAAEVGPIKFDVGEGRATETAIIKSLQPLKASYNFSIDKVKPADFIPDRPDGEYLSAVLASGDITQVDPLPKLPILTAKVAVGEGNLAAAAFKELSLATTIDWPRADIQSFKVVVFGGNVSGSGAVTLDKAPPFSLNLDTNNVDLQQALLVADPKTAALVRGYVDSHLQVSGRGAKFDDIKPTLKGNGRALVRNGKLIGVNLINLTLKKTKGIPEVGEVIPPALMKRHPELFDNADTDIDTASLTFTLDGIRVSTRDLVVQAQDYGMTAAGWFDLDRNLDLSGHALLTRKFSQEIIAEKHNVIYLTNKDGQVDIPLSISGKLSSPNVSPDLATMAQYAASHLMQKTGKDVVDKLFGGKKGKNNPLDQFKGLFH